ncbi:hypothetical protein B0H14DRAFT_3685189, partial [Mycena olivaceomarginata]
MAVPKLYQGEEPLPKFHAGMLPCSARCICTRHPEYTDKMAGQTRTPAMMLQFVRVAILGGEMEALHCLGVGGNLQRCSSLAEIETFLLAKRGGVEDPEVVAVEKCFQPNDCVFHVPLVVFVILRGTPAINVRLVYRFSQVQFLVVPSKGQHGASTQEQLRATKRSNCEKINAVVDTYGFANLGNFLSTLFYHHPRAEADPRSPRHQAVVTRFLQGRTTFQMGHLIQMVYV